MCESNLITAVIASVVLQLALAAFHARSRSGNHAELAKLLGSFWASTPESSSSEPSTPLPQPPTLAQ